MTTVVPCQLTWMLRHVLEGINAKLQESEGHAAAMAAGRKRIEAAALEQAKRGRSATGHAAYGGPLATVGIPRCGTRG